MDAGGRSLCVPGDVAGDNGILGPFDEQPGGPHAVQKITQRGGGWHGSPPACGPGAEKRTTRDQAAQKKSPRIARALLCGAFYLSPHGQSEALNWV